MGKKIKMDEKIRKGWKMKKNHVLIRISSPISIIGLYDVGVFLVWVPYDARAFETKLVKTPFLMYQSGHSGYYVDL